MMRALVLLLMCVPLLADPVAFVGDWKHEKLDLSLATSPAGGLAGTLRLGDRAFTVRATDDGAGGLKGRFATPEGNSFEFTATLAGGALRLKTGKGEFELKKASKPLEDLSEQEPPAPEPPPQERVEFKHPSGLWRMTPPSGWERGPGSDEKTVRWTHGSGALVYVMLIPESPFPDGEQFFQNALAPGLKQAGANFLSGGAVRSEGGPPLYAARFERMRENVKELGELVVAVLSGTGVIFQITIPEAHAEALAKDREAFVSSFRLAADKQPTAPAKFGPEVDAAIERAGGMIDEQQYDGALAILKPLVARGEARAMFLLAYMAREGLGVPKNPTQAFQLYRGSAEAGFPPGMNLLGICYREGLGVPRDFAAAMQWFQKSALRGMGDAALSVGALYVNGQGVPRDLVEGFAWYLVSGTEQADANIEQLYDHLSEQQIAAAERRAEEIGATIEWPGESEGEAGPGTLPAQIMRTEDGRYLVQAVKPGSNAAGAGLEAGDVIVAIDGKKVAGIEPAALGALLEGAAGSMIQLELLRRGQSVQLAFPRDPMR